MVTQQKLAADSAYCRLSNYCTHVFGMEHSRVQHDAFSNGFIADLEKPELDRHSHVPAKQTVPLEQVTHANQAALESLDVRQ